MKGKNKHDVDVLDGSPLTVSFANRDYIWRQRPRRQQRQIRTALADLVGNIYGINEGDQSQQLKLTVDSVNRILDFCEDWNSDMADDIEHIENELRKGGAESMALLMSDVLVPIYKEWLEPWIVSDDDEEQVEEKKTSTMRQNSTS